MRKFLNISLSLLLAASSLVVATNAKAARVVAETPDNDAVSVEHTIVGLPNFDARRDPESLVLNGFNVLSANKMAPVDRTAAIEELKASIPASYPDSVWIDVHDNGAPKTIANHEGFLTGPAVGSPETIARAYLLQYHKALGLTARDVRNLKVVVNDLDKNFGITYLKFQQMVNDVPVYDSEVDVTVTPKGEIAIVNTGQNIEGVRVSTEAALSVEDGIAKAFELCGVSIDASSIQPSASKRVDGSEFTYFTSPLGEGNEDIIFQKTVVNVGGIARLAYRAYVDLNGLEWYNTLVDANTGELLIRYNIVSDVQGQVFTNSPGIAGTGARTLQQFAPQFGVTDPWVGSGTVSTGNNVDAYLDRDANNSPDTTTTAATGSNPGLTSGRADTTKGTPAGEFTFAYSSSNAPTVQQANAVANLFWFNNYMHDWMYSLGFTESARNFQTNNYGRGGTGNDAVKAEAQDGSSTNNANFATPPEGGSGRMQQYIFTYTTPSRDSDLDGDIVLHEYGHGVSNRLVGTSASGLNGTQSGAMGEGWGDYWACSNYNDGVMGEHSTNRSGGIRRAPYSVPAAGIHDSYADLGNGTTGTSTNSFEVHSDGEVWTAALWDLNRTLGKTKADLLVLNGMKNLAPGPSFVTARTNLITACNMLYPADVCTVWTVFARHGLGNSADGNDGTSHIAATDLPASCGGTPSCSSSTTAISSGTPLTQSLATTDCTTTAGNNSAGAYYDTFTFSGTSGQSVTITNNSTAFDAFLRLKNPSNVVVAYDDDSNGGTNSKITYTLAATGTFSIEATSYLTGKTGSYTVTLTGGSAPPPPPGTELVANGGFETTASWTFGTYALRDNLTTPQAGAWCAKFLGRGTTTSSGATAWQAPAFPATGATKTLKFYMKITTAETGSTIYDKLYVRIRNSTGSSILSTMATYSNANSGAYTAWTLVTLTVPATYAVSGNRLYFEGTEDSSLQTTFYIDGVSIQ